MDEPVPAEDPVAEDAVPDEVDANAETRVAPRPLFRDEVLDAPTAAAASQAVPPAAAMAAAGAAGAAALGAAAAGSSADDTQVITPDEATLAQLARLRQAVDGRDAPRVAEKNAQPSRSPRS